MAGWDADACLGNTSTSSQSLPHSLLCCIIVTASSDFSANPNTLWSQETPLRISTLDSRFPPIPKEFEVSPKAQNLCLLLVILLQWTQGDKKMSVFALLTFDWIFTHTLHAHTKTNATTFKGISFSWLCDEQEGEGFEINQRCWRKLMNIRRWRATETSRRRRKEMGWRCGTILPWAAEKRWQWTHGKHCHVWPTGCVHECHLKVLELPATHLFYF